jgi:transcriptional regulator with XRE-family HTH domain
MTPKQSKHLGELVRRQRLKLGMSVRELGKRTDLDSRTVQRLEAGELRRPSFEQLQALADALELPGERVLTVAGFTSESLPALQTYFRAKYNLPTEAIGDLDRYLERLRKRYGGKS